MTIGLAIFLGVVFASGVAYAANRLTVRSNRRASGPPAPRGGFRTHFTEDAEKLMEQIHADSIAQEESFHRLKEYDENEAN